MSVHRLWSQSPEHELRPVGSDSMVFRFPLRWFRKEDLDTLQSVKDEEAADAKAALAIRMRNVVLGLDEERHRSLVRAESEAAMALYCELFGQEKS